MAVRWMTAEDMHRDLGVIKTVSNFSDSSSLEGITFVNWIVSRQSTYITLSALLLLFRRARQRNGLCNSGVQHKGCRSVQSTGSARNGWRWLLG